MTTAGFFAALVAALWAYDGWNNVSMVASEVRDPQRNLPLALIGGTLAVMAIYLFANWAYFHVLTAQQVAANPRVAAEMLRRIVGDWGANAVSVAAMISIFAALNGSILTGSRVPYAAARDGLFFRAVAWVHPQFRTPGISILALTPVGFRADRAFRRLQGTVHVCDIRELDSLWDGDGRRDCVAKKASGSSPAVPNVRLSVCTVVICFGGCFISDIHLMDSPRESLKGLFIVLAGMPFYYYWKNRSR